MAQVLGNIQYRSSETDTEKLWRLFGEELQREMKGFTFKKGTSNSNNNGYKQHKEARDEKFDFVFYFKDWDTQVYDNIPGFHKGEFTGELKEWMWDYNFTLNVEVKRVGMGNLNSVMPDRFMKAFNIPAQDRDKWLITDFSNVLKIRNFGGIIYIFENGVDQVHHIFHDQDIHLSSVGSYVVDWEGDPTKVGGGGYKAKTLLNKEYSVKFDTFEEVKQYILSMSDNMLFIEKEKNRRLFYKNIEEQKTEILPYSPGKLKYAKMQPQMFVEGLLKPAPKNQINCKQINEYELNCYDYEGHVAYECETCMGAANE